MFPDRAIREAVWPTNGARPTVYVPACRAEFGPIHESQIQPVSLDVRLGPDFIRHPSGEEVGLDPHFTLTLQPGQCVLGNLVERFRMGSDNVVARVEGKSSWARRFLTVHAAGLIDPGFCGDITLELKNDGHSPIQLTPGVPIAQVTFQFLAAPVDRLYGDWGLNSHYQNQEGATPAWNSARNGETH
jgi:dCTP deaminase